MGHFRDGFTGQMTHTTLSDSILECDFNLGIELSVTYYQRTYVL